MRRLVTYNTVSEAENASMLLRSHGIVTHVGAHTGTVLNGLLHGVTDVSVWIVLDHQYEDAEKLLINDQHSVTTGLTPDEMSEYTQSSEAHVYRSFNRAILAGLVLIVIVALVTVWVLTSW